MQTGRDTKVRGSKISSMAGGRSSGKMDLSSRAFLSMVRSREQASLFGQTIVNMSAIFMITTYQAQEFTLGKTRESSTAHGRTT